MAAADRSFTEYVCLCIFINSLSGQLLLFFAVVVVVVVVGSVGVILSRLCIQFISTFVL